MQRHPLGRLRSALSKQQWTVAFGAAGLLLTTTACGGGAAPAGGTTAPASGGAAAPAGEAKPAVNRLVFITEPPNRSTLEVRHLSEPYAWVTRPMYDYLMNIDPKTGKVVPGMATEWKVEPDGKSFRLQLRKGVKFHGDWGNVTAKDFAFALEQVKLTDSLHGQAPYWKSTVESAEVVNDNEIIFHLTRPDGQFVTNASEQAGGVEAQSKANFDKTGPATWKSGPLAGSGPYQFVEAAENQYVRYKRIEGTHPWRNMPAFNEFEWRYAKEPSTRLAALLSNEAHMAPLPDDLMVTAEKQGGMKTLRATFPGNRIFGNFLCCYLKEPNNPDSGAYYPNAPLMDKRVRQALNKAIDRDELNKAFFSGEGQPMFLTHQDANRLGWNPDWEKRFKGEYSYDPEGAKKLLAEAGQTNLTITMQVLAVAGVGVSSSDLLETIGAYWRKVVVNTVIDQTDAPTVQAARRERKYSNNFTVSASGSDIWGGYGVWNSPSLHLGVEDPEVEKLIAQLKLTIDEKKQDELWRQVGERSFSQFQNVNLFWLPVKVSVNPKIVGEWTFPGSISGAWTHVENIKPAR